MFEPSDLANLLMNTLAAREGRVGKALDKVWPFQESPLQKITMLVAHDVQRQVRMLITEQLMSLWLPPGEVVQLGRDLARPFPENLQTLTNPDVLRLLAGFDPTPDSERGSGVKDWADFQQRMRFIADLFRAYEEDTRLFDPV